ncbi:MAG: hypothetical protein CBB71_03975 [Rhodopirellula sp. TMED11]|nr:MAG: hypothetical protein CBB71_03975 [Rhodopirellula sp. TMED11]
MGLAPLKRRPPSLLGNLPKRHSAAFVGLLGTQIRGLQRLAASATGTALLAVSVMREIAHFEPPQADWYRVGNG